MNRDIQDKALYKIYEGLPVLQYINPLDGFGTVLPLPGVTVMSILSINTGIINLHGQPFPNCVLSFPMI